jgi:mannose-6-phosphate isomerase-like protein (cupin superfamily)
MFEQSRELAETSLLNIRIINLIDHKEVARLLPLHWHSTNAYTFQTMSNPTPKPIIPKPVVLSANKVHALPIESFPDPARGKVAWRTLFSQPKTPTTDLSAGIAVCPEYSGYLCSHHHAQAEIYFILEGRGIVTINGVRYDVEKGSAVFIPGDMEHSVENCEQEELKWLYVFPTGYFEHAVYHFTGKGRSKL